MRGLPNTSPAVDGAVDPDLSAAITIHVPHLSECYPDRRRADKTASRLRGVRYSSTEGRVSGEYEIRPSMRPFAGSIAWLLSPLAGQGLLIPLRLILLSRYTGIGSAL